jgi:nitric oxide reductase large subunit
MLAKEMQEMTFHNYSRYIDILFPAEGDITAWGFITNVLTAWTTITGEEVFWLMILPLPILGYWLKQKSTEIPIIVYLVLGGIFTQVAPEVMQTPARLMLMFGIAGILYHLFKNRS